MADAPVGAGKSSFELIQPQDLFTELPLSSESRFLDVACGAGAYSLAVAELAGDTATIYAIDLWSEGIAILNEAIAKRRLKQIKTAVTDATKEIPVPDASIDICLLATVLHDFLSLGSEQGALREIKRVMKPGATLAVVEFKVMDGPPGPPRAVRIPPETVQELVTPFGFQRVKTKELGPYNYLSLFLLQP